jgi:hypothetical protein
LSCAYTCERNDSVLIRLSLATGQLLPKPALDGDDLTNARIGVSIDRVHR